MNRGTGRGSLTRREPITFKEWPTRRPMGKKGTSNPEVYRVLRGVLGRQFLLREPFDNLLEQTGAVEQIVALWDAQCLPRKASDSEAPEDFQRMETRRDYIRQRLLDRLYWAAVLTVIEADLGPEAPREDIEEWEKAMAVLGRRDEWLPKQGRPQGAKTRRPARRDEKEEIRRNQTLEAIGAIHRESSELAPLALITRKAVAQKLGINERELRRWIHDYEWDWDLMESKWALETLRRSGHGNKK